MKIFITSCDGRLNYAKKVQEMMKDSPYEYVFVYGKGNKHMLDPHIEIDEQEAYENLPSKTYFLVKYFMENHNDSQLLKMNDDTFLDFTKLRQYESAIQDYIGFFHDYELGRFNKFFHWYKVTNPAFKVFKRQVPLKYAEGAMYILSRKACERILQKGREFFRSLPETYLGEDLKVGLTLDCPDIVKWDIKHPNELNYEVTTDFMSIHPVSLLMFDKLKAAKTNEQKMEILRRYCSLNENALRIDFLTRTERELIGKSKDGDVS